MFLSITKERGFKRCDNMDTGETDRQKVLVAEGAPILRELLTEYYELKGIEVVSVSTGDSAIETFKAKPESFDLVVVDWILPGLSGKKLIEKMLSIKQHQKIVILTGYADDEKILLLAKSPNIEILVKPLKLSELDKIIQKI